MILISAIEGHTHSQSIIEANTVQQDTIKKDTTLIKKQNKYDFKEQKKVREYEEWQARSQRMDENMKKMAEQSALMDSLLGYPDTTVIVK